MPRKERPIPPLFSRVRSLQEFRTVTPVLLADDPVGMARVSSFDTRPNVNDMLSRCCRLVVQWMVCSLRLRSLGCSLLSQGVIATMNRSNSSCAPLSLLSPSESGSAARSRRARSTRGLPRSRTSLFPSSRRQSRHGVYLCWTSPYWAGSSTRVRRIAFTFVPG